MPSGPVDPVDLVLSNTVLVMLGVNGSGGSLRGLILLCVLSRRSTQRASFYSHMGKQNNMTTREILIFSM